MRKKTHVLSLLLACATAFGQSSYDLVIVGGNMAAAGDYIMLPLKSSTNKYSLNLVYKDTKFRLSKLNENANAWGVAMLIRNQVIGL